MEKRTSDFTTIQLELEAAQKKIRVLEDQLSQQKEIHQALREDHAFREAVIENAAEGVCVCHDIPIYPNIKFTVWNQRMIEITGYTMEEINNLGWYQSMYPDPEVQKRARERMDRMRDGDDLKFERWEITRADEKKRSIAISTSILTAKDNSVYVLGLMHDFTEEQRLREEAMLARIDYLTGVKNRRGFFENARLLFELAVRQTKPLTFAYLDVDGLKTINDTYGHYEGDQLLKSVGAILLRAVRSADVVGRLGGDEFAVVYLDTTASNAKTVVNRLDKQLLEMIENFGWESGVSIGVVTFSGFIPGIEAAITYADALMYKAKEQGKSGIVFEEIASEDRILNNT